MNTRKPRTQASKEALRETLLRIGSSSTPASQASSVGLARRYAQLVSAEGLADGVWHREGKIHEFVLVLTNSNRESLHKAYKTEIDLQREFPLVGLDFQWGRSPLSVQDKADLGTKRYTWVSP